jgi:putative phosphoribosyl transferase
VLWPFEDRHDAGRRLAERLAAAWRGPRPLVWGVARGGVVVAQPVAERLAGDLDVVVVRKIAAPHAPEYALGAVTAYGEPLWTDVAADLAPAALRAEWARAAQEAARRREERYRSAGRADPAGRAVVVVDDGAATGASVRAAVRAARAAGAATVVVALPVATPAAADMLAGEADEVVVLLADPDLRAVSQYYRDFGEVGDDTVLALLERSGRSGGMTRDGFGP